ncbi:helix-turn-helix domain-containing protein [Caulobacter rhizosphaerae]|jgi:transcriptional regulator with XRE-family HTH domain|uniref:helix-turn-helix domain-containing protein n=1 Tax=Caulobacter rhizosphaerae TaxID=2010972 RepID=UPI0013D24B11|nr:helix-turn-helix domain-containing protein [Caulobacter rhizosphaerae]GGL18134.1 hypothetical protein GCM10010983_14290 [Caulobacter rhizosphaerae]
MRTDIFQTLGKAVKTARHAKGLTQEQLAKRLGREQGRVSELETDLTRGRLGKDRLTLLAEICDALDLVPVLVPRDQARAVASLHAGGDKDASKTGPHPHAHGLARSTFDELFVDLGDDEEDHPDG